ncbi:MAG: 50S ribosomal protein L25 [Candidatus Zambryskibacteria bacterium]|nr:50S ribosomal protein L25 [Candidatus Zambryskibacteria bacterium]
MITLDIEVRNKDNSLDTLRKAGKMPAVFYGPGSRAEHATGQSKKTVSTSISISQKDFLKVWKTAGESGVVTLKGPKENLDTLIHAVDIDPISDIPRHADFYVFEKGKKLEVSVPLDFIGVSPVVKDLGGSLVKALHELKISADPQHIPHNIKVDVSAIVDFDSQILAKDVILPKEVVLIELANEVVVSGARPKEEEKEEASPVDLSSIEVEKKGKKDLPAQAGEESTESATEIKESVK